MENNRPTENIRDKKERVLRIIEILEKTYPHPQIALRFNNPLELLIATILSAQCTDEKVNKVTESLFKKYRGAEDYASVDLSTLEEDVKSTGFYKNKARAIKEAANKIVNDFEGNIPQTMEELVTLTGVGRKTASIVLGNAFGKQAIAVDTHVKRISRRLGLVRSENPERIEGGIKRDNSSLKVDTCYKSFDMAWKAYLSGEISQKRYMFFKRSMPVGMKEQRR